MNKLALYIFVFSVFPVINSHAQARYYVDAAAIGVNDGSSWSDAFTDLQSALAVATIEDTIWVAKGIYLPATDNDRTATFTIDGESIFGGFAGGETSLAQRDLARNETILRGEIQNNGKLSDNTLHVITITSNNTIQIIDGFIIREGSATGSIGRPRTGGGLISVSEAGKSSDLIISNCTFENNQAFTGGAVMLDGASYVVFQNTVFKNNLARIQGGAIDGRGAVQTTLVNCTLADNSVIEPGTGGSAISSSLSAFSVLNTLFAGHSDPDGSYYIFTDNSGQDLEFDACLFPDDPSANSNVAASVFMNNIVNSDPGIDDDLMPVEGAAGINAGMPAGNLILPYDRAGNKRIMDGTIDIGAFEFNGLPMVNRGIERQSVINGNYFELTVTENVFSDRGGFDNLTFTAELADGTPLDGSGWLFFSGSEFTGIPAIDDVGMYTIKLTATDAEDNSVTLELAVEVVRSTVQFSEAIANIPEEGGTIEVKFRTNGPCSSATSFDLVLTTGDPADVDNYTTQTVTFPAGSVGEQSLTLNITDDTIDEEDEVLTFTLQNISGGCPTVAGEDDEFKLTIVDNDVVTGTGKESQDTPLTVYPNPATEVVWITHDGHGPASIEVYDVGGRLKLKQIDVTGRAIVIKVDQLPVGSYLIKIINGNKLTTRRFIKN